MRNKNFFILWIASFAFWSSVAAHSTIYPIYMDQAGFDAAWIGFVTGSAALGGLLVRPFVGWAVDRWGTRPFLLAGAAFWFLTSPLTGFTTNSVLLLLLRIVPGIGGGLFTAAALGYVGYVTPLERRGRAISWWDTSSSSGNLLAPVAIVILIMVIGFSGAFWVAGLAALVSLILAWFLPQVVPGEHHPHSRIRFRMFSRSALLPGIFTVVAGFCTGGVIVLGPLVGDQLGLQNVGLFVMLFSIGTLLVRPLAAPLSDSRGRAWVILPGFLLMTAALAFIGAAPGVWSGYISPLVFGLGLGSAAPGLMALCVDGSDLNERGTAGNTYFFFWEIGIFAGAYLQGAVLDSAGLPGFLLPAGMCLIATGVFWVLFRQPRLIKAGGIVGD
jgi:MFS family permease